MKKYYLVFIILAALIATAAIFETLGARAPLSDQQTESDIQTIETAIESYTSKNGRLPSKLDEVTFSGDIQKRVGKYDYSVKSSDQYQVCANFKTDTTKNQRYPISVNSIYQDDNPQYHQKGHQCFTKTSYGIYDNSSSNNYGSTYSSSNLDKVARDTERQTDIKALHAQLEAYFAQNGRYPTLANLNDNNGSSSWVGTNLKGLDREAFKDPKGISYALAAKPASYVYAYAVLPANCDNLKTDCVSYTLTATLESGSTYTKTSLN